MKPAKTPANSMETIAHWFEKTVLRNHKASLSVARRSDGCYVMEIKGNDHGRFGVVALTGNPHLPLGERLLAIPLEGGQTVDGVLEMVETEPPKENTWLVPDELVYAQLADEGNDDE